MDDAFAVEEDMQPIQFDPEPLQPNAEDAQKTPDDVRKLVSKIIATIKEDRKYHAKAFKRMKRDMQLAMHGYDDANWNDTLYSANICGRHVKQKTAQLYAKNPRAVARRRETLDFVIWDETPESLKQAFQAVQLGTQALNMAAQAPPQVDPTTGEPVDPMAAAPPEMKAAFEQAQAVIKDYQEGMTRRTEIKKLGRTLEILFSYAMREQKPVEFKKGMKSLVRRACTTGVGYLELGFQREYGPRPAMQEKLTDARARLDHLARLVEEASEGEIDAMDAEMAELNASIASLQAEPEIILREGLIVDFPASTKVIPDKLCTALDGFIGARHIAVEYLYTCDEVQEIFGVDLKRSYRGYSPTGEYSDGSDQGELFVSDVDEINHPADKGKGLVCVWKYYDKPSGLVYYVADGYQGMLREPAAPDVFVDDFWPVYALTFNACESEDELFPLSDVALIKSMQEEHNRSRQGKREHRQAARPRWVYPNGALDDEDIKKLAGMKPFDTVGLNIDPQSDLDKILKPIPVPGVDPNLYDTGEVFQDTQVVVGSQQSQFGGLSSKATATEASIAAGASNSADGSSVDDLDAFLSSVARASGQILMREMSQEKVAEIAGPGAVWPPMSLADIANEIYLEVQAGSTGKPNQAIEIDNWQKMLPFIMQMPGLSPTWIARETVRRLDDNVDLTEALSAGIPSLVAQNALASAAAQIQPAGPGPAAPEGGQGDDPRAQGAHGTAQGPKGANNGPAAPPEQQRGSEPAFGNNQM